jgi:nucleotide-binding universal stress UspA family protein
MDIKKVLVPVDFSENSKKILEAAGYFSGKCQAKLHVVFVVQSFDDYEEIIRHTEESGMDLIVMGTHGYKGLEKVMFGSVAEKVVRSSPCPVLTINPYKNL